MKNEERSRLRKLADQLDHRNKQLVKSTLDEIFSSLNFNKGSAIIPRQKNTSQILEFLYDNIVFYNTDFLYEEKAYREDDEYFLSFIDDKLDELEYFRYLLSKTIDSEKDSSHDVDLINLPKSYTLHEAKQPQLKKNDKLVLAFRTNYSKAYKYFKYLAFHFDKHFTYEELTQMLGEKYPDRVKNHNNNIRKRLREVNELLKKTDFVIEISKGAKLTLKR